MATITATYGNVFDGQWTGAEYFEHYEGNTPRLHKFWLAKVNVNHTTVAVGRAKDGEPQPGCPIDIAMFSTEQAAKKFVRQFLDSLRKKHVPSL